MQGFWNNLVDEHIEEILDRIATYLDDAANIEIVDYNSVRHQGVLMNYVWEGVQKIQAVRPDSYLDQALSIVQTAVNRANQALADIESQNGQISEEEQRRVLAETARANAETARATAEQLRVLAEAARVQAENDRGTAETARQQAETTRQQAETSRSSWFNTFRSTVESWFSNPTAGTGIQERWNTFWTSVQNLVDDFSSRFWTFFGANANSGIQGTWNGWWPRVLSQWADLQQDAEDATQAALDAADAAEAQGNAAEAQGNAAEAQGNAAEAQGNAAEAQGNAAEAQGNAAEAQGDIAELQGQGAADQAAAAAAAEQTRASNYATLLQNIQNLYQQMLTRANHPAQFGADGYIYEYDLTTEQYVKTNHFWQKLERFRISKEFASVTAMEAYDPTNLPQGEDPLEKFDFVRIKSTVSDPDNSKLYSYLGENVDNEQNFERWHFLGDFSGAQGFEGKTPQFSIGTVLAGAAGTNPVVSITANGTDANGNPCFLINFTIPRGADGRGIASLQQVQQSNVSEGENIWRATFTDGATADLIVLNGAQGANAGIGEATATVGSGVGTPSVTVNTGGTNANRIFSFAFNNIKGATFTPSVDANGNLSWTNDGGLTNPSSFNILSAIPVCSQLQQGLMSASDKEKLDLLPSMASSTINAVTAADLSSGKVAFWGEQDNNGKWTLQKMSKEEMQKLAYDYIKGSTQLSELAQLLGVVENSIPYQRNNNTSNDYITPRISYNYGSSGSSIRMSFPFDWGGNHYCVQFVIIPYTGELRVRSHSGGEWGAYKNIILT